MNDPIDHSIATINATVGLVLALRALARPHSYVAAPATVCPNVIAAILAADCFPFFVDIDRKTFGLDPKALKSDIGAVSAIVAVHALGEPCRINDIADICHHHGVVLIEDCAQADGATHSGRLVGSWGDASIFSYGRGKIVDLGDGGLLVGRTTEIRSRLERTLESLPSTRNPLDALEITARINSTYKSLYNKGYPSDLDSYQAEFSETLAQMRDLGLARAPASKLNDIMFARKTRLATTLARRRAKSSLYRSQFADVPGLVVLPTTSESAPWRFNIWIEGKLRDPLLKSMLADGINVSSWHPDIRPFLPKSLYKSGALPSSKWYSKGVLNLWLDDQTSESDVLRTSEDVKARMAALSCVTRDRRQ